jgi:TRAP-type C4-dicarboxylate transport system permease small subunit
MSAGQETSVAPAGPLPGLARASFIVAGAALVLLVGVEFWQVLARYLLNDSPGWTEPAALFLLTTAMSLGAAGAVQQGAHFGFFVLREISPMPRRRLLVLFSEGVVATLGGVLAIGAGTLLADGWEVPGAGSVLPQSANYLPMCIGGVLMTVFALARLRRGVTATATEPAR